MSTAAQILANQANAQKSTGPKTDTGKAISAQNRRSHGLTYTGGAFAVLPCENQADYERLLAELHEEYVPASATESLLVTRMAQHQWLRDRSLRLQESCFDPATGEIADIKKLSLYLRYSTAHERAFHRCLSDLLKLIATKQKIQNGFESEKRKKELHPIHVMQKEMEVTMLQIRESASHRTQPLPGANQAA
jgi:hypothetical protein